ncbi:MAG TPA: AMP-binding protein [Polyangiaceae bacterium]|nr:AMP-binding protein [Polyangiaceae bacterium]
MEARELLSALNEAIAHARASAFHAARLPRAPLSSLADLATLPLTTRAHLREQAPFGLVCAPRRELLQYHESSGTTGVPVSVWYTARDLSEIHARLAAWGVGFAPGDRVLVRFPYALSTIGHFVHAAAQRAGACVIPADSQTHITPLATIVDRLRWLEVTVLCANSQSAVMIAESAEMAGLDPRRDFPHLRAIACAGEPLCPERREFLRELFGVPVFDNYGMTEMGPIALDCAHQRLHPLPDQALLELLDDRLEREVAPGETGQLVVTTLGRRATPLVRYVTGDRVTRVEEPCECGQKTTLQVRGRLEDAPVVGGRRFDLRELSAIAGRLPARRFWRVTPSPTGLSFVVEREREDDRVEPALLAELARTHGVPLRVELVPKGTLYDRTEPISFGMKGKPVYIDAAAAKAAAPVTERRGHR